MTHLNLKQGVYKDHWKIEVRGHKGMDFVVYDSMGQVSSDFFARCTVLTNAAVEGCDGRVTIEAKGLTTSYLDPMTLPEALAKLEGDPAKNMVSGAGYLQKALASAVEMSNENALHIQVLQNGYMWSKAGEGLRNSSGTQDELAAVLQNDDVQVYLSYVSKDTNNPKHRGKMTLEEFSHLELRDERAQSVVQEITAMLPANEMQPT